MPKQILRVEPIHSSQAFASKWKHNMRLGDIPNADSSKTWKNEQLIRLPVGETYLTCFERKIASLPSGPSGRDLHVKYYEYTRECGLVPESRYMHIEHDKVGRFYSNINLALEKQLPSPMEGESLETYVVRADECYKDQMLRSLGRSRGCVRMMIWLN